MVDDAQYDPSRIYEAAYIQQEPHTGFWAVYTRSRVEPSTQIAAFIAQTAAQQYVHDYHTMPRGVFKAKYKEPYDLPVRDPATIPDAYGDW